MKVATLPEESYTEQAARVRFPDAEFSFQKSIRDIILAVEQEKADFGVVPIENIYEGDVKLTLKTLTRCSHIKIVDERWGQIVHCLGALPNYETIKRIFSKEEALEQCEEYLTTHYPEATWIPTSSTVEAARMVSGEALSDAAAIASEDALAETGLEMLARDICPNNRTRFFVLGRETPRPTGDDKTFLVFYPPEDRPGVLHACLGYLAGLNLEFIQSRSDRNKGYCFCMELNGHIEDDPVSKFVDTLRCFLDPKDKYSAIKIFGSYKNSHWKDG